MPGLRDLLKKKERIHKTQPDQRDQASNEEQQIPNITFLRTTTNLTEQIEPPDQLGPPSPSSSKTPKHFSRPFPLHDSHNTSNPARRSYDHSYSQNYEQTASEQPRQRRLSNLLHRQGRSRSKSDASNSAYLPQDLGEAPPLPTISVSSGTNQEQRTQEEARWEKRATVLATSGSLLGTSQEMSTRDRSPSISDAQGDVNIQEAIRLHEAGDLANSTRMFGRLADPRGANNALSQILYGLALRHGWGIEVSEQKAVQYLSLAATNSASIEQHALAAGMSKGGAAKGELVLAIFELANCLRSGLGVKKDPVAARQYYETAANLGDTDAMAEIAWCYLDGFGGPKDKFKAAQYLRLAESQGVKAVGNSWIWKDKYNPKS